MPLYETACMCSGDHRRQRAFMLKWRSPLPLLRPPGPPVPPAPPSLPVLPRPRVAALHVQRARVRSIASMHAPLQHTSWPS